MVKYCNKLLCAVFVSAMAVVTVGMTDAFAAKAVTLTGDIAPIKVEEEGETYIDIEDWDHVFGKIETDSEYTTLDVKDILKNSLFDDCKVLDMKVHDNNGTKTIEFVDSEGIIHEKSNLNVVNNKVEVTNVKVAKGTGFTLKAPSGATSVNGYRWIQLFSDSGKEIIEIDGKKVEYEMEKYQVVDFVTKRTDTYAMEVSSTLDEGIYICLTADEKTRMSQIVGMYNVVFTDDVVVGNLSAINTVARGTYALKIGWNKATNANGYIVYMRKDGTWKRITEISDTNFMFLGLKPGTSYIFAVRPFYNNPKSGKTVYSSKVTTVVTTTKPLKPAKVVVSKRAYTAVKLTWTKSVGATGYALYQQVGTKWVRVKNVISNVGLMNGLKRNTTYRFAVRPYKRTGNTVVYADSYTPVSVKTLK